MRTTVVRRALATGAVCATAVLGAPARAQVAPYATRAAFRAAVGPAPTDVFDGIGSGQIITNGYTIGGMPGFTFDRIRFDLSDASADFHVSNTSQFGPKVSEYNVMTKYVNVPGAFLGYDARFAPTDVITFSFVSPVRFFGLSFGAPGVAGGLFSVFADGVQVATSGYDPFPGSLDGQFAGFVSATPVSAVTVRVAAGSASFYLDDLLVGAQVVPEPSTGALLVAGAAGVGAVARRHRRAATV